jgi:hypothetical protein
LPSLSSFSLAQNDKSMLNFCRNAFHSMLTAMFLGSDFKNFRCNYKFLSRSDKFILLNFNSFLMRIKFLSNDDTENVLHRAKTGNVMLHRIGSETLRRERKYVSIQKIISFAL